MLYCFYFSDTEAFEACFRLLHDDDDDVGILSVHLVSKYAGEKIPECIRFSSSFVINLVFPCISTVFKSPMPDLSLRLLLTYFQNILAFCLHCDATSFCSLIVILHVSFRTALRSLLYFLWTSWSRVSTYLVHNLFLYAIFYVMTCLMDVPKNLFSKNSLLVLSILSIMLRYPTMSSWVYLEYGSLVLNLLQTDPFLPECMSIVCQFSLFDRCKLLVTPAVLSTHSLVHDTLKMCLRHFILKASILYSSSFFKVL